MANDAEPTIARDQGLGDLPNWDLDDLYPGPDSQALKDDLDRCAVEAKAFRDRYEGKLAGLEGAGLGAAIAAYEALQETLGRAGSYAQLVYAGDMSDPEIGRFYQGIQERTTEISAQILFFTLELNRLEDGDLEEKLTAPALAHYGPWLRDLRASRAHDLSDELERLLHEKHVVGRAAWTRLFDENMAALRFPLDGEALTSAEILSKMTDRDPKLREAAAKSLGAVLGENQRTFALITNTLAKDKEIEDSWRSYARPVSSRNLENLVEDEVVEALVAAVRDAFPRLSHRYYALKAKWFGVEQLNYWDRNAPLPEDHDRLIPWDQAQVTVLNAYAAWGDECVKRFNGMFAFVIHDERRRRLFGARDRMGKKPLCYLCERGMFAFASEPGALLQHPMARRELDPEAMARYFVFEHVPAPMTIYKGMRKLPSAHRFEFDLDTEVIQRNRVTQRDPVRRAFGCLDPGQAGHGQRIALGQAVGGECREGLRVEPHTPARHRAAPGFAFRTGVHHTCLPLPVRVGQPGHPCPLSGVPC